jgi:DNA-binding NarL/FixJ family response regulator
LRTGASAGASTPRPLTVLTQREREVAELVAAGLRDSEVATRMYLSPFTVKGYVKSIYRKLGLRSRVELTRVFMAQEPPPSFPPPPEDPPTTGTACLDR